MVQILYHGFVAVGSEWVMWILFLLSVVSVAIIFERFRTITREEKNGSSFWVENANQWLMASPKPSGAKVSEEVSSALKAYPCCETELADLIIKNRGASTEDLERLIQSYLGKKRIDLEKFLAFLGTVGSNAPFIGLFGTVLGIIRAFKELGVNVEGGVQAVSSGLAEALVATAVGLLVAIPAVVFFNYYQRKVKSVMARAESLGRLLLTVKF